MIRNETEQKEAVERVVQEAGRLVLTRLASFKGVCEHTRGALSARAFPPQSDHRVGGLNQLVAYRRAGTRPEPRELVACRGRLGSRHKVIKQRGRVTALSHDSKSVQHSAPVLP